MSCAAARSAGRRIYSPSSHPPTHTSRAMLSSEAASSSLSGHGRTPISTASSPIEPKQSLPVLIHSQAATPSQLHFRKSSIPRPCPRHSAASGADNLRQGQPPSLDPPRPNEDPHPRLSALFKHFTCILHLTTAFLFGDSLPNPAGQHKYPLQ